MTTDPHRDPAQPDTPTPSDAPSTARPGRTGTTWADRARGTFLLREDVTVEATEAAVTEALRVAEEAGESPEALFGDARLWAHTEVERWRTEGTGPFDGHDAADSTADAPAGPTTAEPTSPAPPVFSRAALFETDPRFTVRSLVLGTLIGAALISVVWAIVARITEGTTVTVTLGAAASPVLLSFLGLLTVFLREHWTRRRGKTRGTLLTIAVLAPLVIATAVFFVGTTHLTREIPVGWWLGAAVGFVTAEVVLSKLWPAPTRPADAKGRGQDVARTQGPDAAHDATAEEAAFLSDEQWATEVAEELRVRGSHGEQHVREALEEARAHAAEAGTGLHQEFGAPQDYARRLPEHPHVVATRMGVLWSIAFLSSLVWLALLVRDGDFSFTSWLPILWALFSGWSLVSAIRTLRSVRRGAAPWAGQA